MIETAFLIAAAGIVGYRIGYIIAITRVEQIIVKVDKKHKARGL